MVTNETISMGHARVLSKLEDESKIIDLANQTVEKQLSVRDLEKVAEDNSFERKVKITRRREEDNKDYKYVEDLLRDKLDTKVRIKDKKIEISFNNVADLNRILEIINVKE